MHAEILRVLSVTPPDESLGIGADESTGSFSNEATKVYDFQGVRARRRSRAGSSGTKEALVAPPPDLSLPQVVSALPRAALPSAPPPPPQFDVSALATSPSGPPMAFAGYAAAPVVVSAPPYRPMPSERPAPPAPPEASGGRRPLLLVAAVITALLVVAAGLSLRRAPAPVDPAEHLAVAPAVVDASLPLPNAALDVGVVALPVVQQVLQHPTTPAPPPRPRSENPDRTERPDRGVRTLPAPAGDGRPLDSSEFLAAVSPSTPRFSQCLHGQGGTVDVNVAIDARGRLGDTAFRRPPQGSGEAECIARVLRGLRFPRNRPTSTRLYLNVRERLRRDGLVWQVWGVSAWCVAPISDPSPASGEGWRAAGRGMVQPSRNAWEATPSASHRPSLTRLDHRSVSASPPFPRGGGRAGDGGHTPRTHRDIHRGSAR